MPPQFAEPMGGGPGGGQVRTELTRMFERRREKRKHKNFTEDLALVGLLFARPSDPFAKQNVVPELDYFNSRSGEHMDFFCVGYSKKPRSPSVRGTEPAVIVNGKKWWFDNDGFDHIREEIAANSKWEYGGGTEFLIANAKSSLFDGTSIDYSSAIQCNLEQMEKDKAIRSVREFFERVFKYAENPGENPAVRLSRAFEEKVGVSAVKKIILKILLRSLADEFEGAYDKARHFVVIDLSRKN